MELLKKKYLSLVDWSTSSSNKKLLIFILLGLILIGFGVLAYKIELFSSGDSIEILNDVKESPGSHLDITVEIAGAVEKEGVYKMKSGDRVDDLLIASGGLSVDADRDWVVKNINRAGKLIDGQKIYIYHLGEESDNRSGGIKLDQGVLGAESQNSGNLININTASQKELEKLVGIGPVFATNIIEHRPYSDIQDLVSKGAISQKILEKIKNEISVY